MNCLHCNDPILQRRDRSKYCSNSCNNAAYYLRHKDRILTRNKLWNKKNQSICTAAALRWKKRNPTKNCHLSLIHQDRVRGAEGSFTLQEWEEVKQKHNNCCAKCGKHESVAKLTRDHIKPISKGGSNYISNIQPLCASCNSHKSNHL